MKLFTLTTMLLTLVLSGNGYAQEQEQDAYEKLKDDLRQQNQMYEMQNQTRALRDMQRSMQKQEREREHLEKQKRLNRASGY